MWVQYQRIPVGVPANQKRSLVCSGAGESYVDSAPSRVVSGMSNTLIR